MRILGIERDQTACNYYRILQPLHKLDEKDIAEVSIIHERQLGDERSAQLALASDVIVFQRPATEAWFNFIKLCRKLGKIIVSDYDDDPFNTSPLNPYYAFIGTEPVWWEWPDGKGEWLWSEDMVSATGHKIFNIERNINHRDMFRLNFKRSDIVTCTTETLKEQFLKINQNVFVLPNVIDVDFFPHTAQLVKKEIRIGWQGGASHYEDLYMVRDAIVEVLKRNNNVKFVYFGDYRFQGLFKDAPQNKIEFHAWVPHNVYPYKLAFLNLDIGLCPLVDNTFNRNKSAIKWMEYSALNIATVASDIPPYSNVLRNGDTAMMVSSDDTREWVHAIEHLIHKDKIRKKLAFNAHDDVIKNHNAGEHAHLWCEAYEKAMKGELNVVHVP